MKIKMLLSLSLVCLVITLKANVKPNSLFSNNMILQREVVLSVWGTASEGEKIFVEFCGQKVRTVAKNGKWEVTLQPLQPGGPFTMIIQGNNRIEIENVLVGDVWVLSGQSNIERQLGPRRGQKPIVNWEEEAAFANFPQIRQFYVEKNSTEHPVDDVNSKWVICDPQTVIDFSAVGFFFAREIHQNLSVPIGLLFSSVGGTSIDKWTSRETQLQHPMLKKGVDAFFKSVENFDTDLANFKRDSASLLQKWKEETRIAELNKTTLPRKPQTPVHPYLSGRNGGYYYAMIAPLLPYKVKGIVWYQGESDRYKADLYRIIFPLMISEWRKGWGSEKLPFLFVQIAPKFDYTPEIREAQLLTFKEVPYTAMAVLTDCGDSLDSHPALKQPVGHRLALGAKAIAYGQKITYSGPIYKSMKVVGNTIEVEFDFIGKGLEARDGDLRDFEIAGADKKYISAKAFIKGDKVVVSANDISSPVAVRMGWFNYPHVNLYNKDGLPASPFRSEFN